MAKRTKSNEAPPADANPLDPRFTPDVFGHADAKARFLRGYLSGSLHHAWMLTGIKGVGKATFAYRAARFLLNQEISAAQPDATSAANLDIPPASRAFQQIAAQAHPSLFVLESGGGSIAVDAVRKLKGFMGLTSPGGWRVVIVDDANGLTASSANALLKALEEPPPRTVFFLVVQGAAAVMPTIRSRCVRLNFQPLAPPTLREAVREALARGHLTGSALEIENACAVANGSVRDAMALLEEGGGVRSKLDALVSSLPQADGQSLHAFLRLVQGPRNAAAFTSVCDGVEGMIESKAKASVQSADLAQAAHWASLWSWFRAERADVETLNLDKAAFLMAAFSDMTCIARGKPPLFPSSTRASAIAS